MASSILQGLVTNYDRLGYQLWHQPLNMASLVYEREIDGVLVNCLRSQLTKIRIQVIQLAA